MQQCYYWFGSLVLSFLLFPSLIGAQCSTQVTHLSGTQQVGCTEVTVTAAGSAGNLTLCSKGPYIIGNIGEGSYTFTFSPAISGVKFGVYALNNNALGFEELAVSINNAFYPITNPGVADGCLPEAVISGSGTIQACANCASSWDDIEITESINSIKFEDIYLAGGPAGMLFSLYICCPLCPTDAGEITASPLAVCLENAATIPAAVQTYLDSDDILQYILFTNPGDTLGSIIATSNSPSIFFNPATMQTGVTYYIAAIAGNNSSGTVNQNDPCLDISNAIPVSWWPKPAVELSIADPTICAGSCSTVTANFSGSAPFVLTYTTPGTGIVVQTFQENSATFPVCAPAGSAPGSFVLQATKVSDVHCTCF